MPAKWFICPNGQKIEIEECIKDGGCPYYDSDDRCMELPMLRRISFGRNEYRGITPSKAGNGPRMEYLKAIIDYAIVPDEMMFALLGIGVHDNLAAKKYTTDMLAEEQLDGGRPDLLTEDEKIKNVYNLTDYKTWGSYAVSKAMGLLKDKEADIRGPALQVNRYRIMYEANGFMINRMKVRAIVRDGGTWMAKKSGITKKTYSIDIPCIEDEWVLAYYNNLSAEVEEAFKTGYARLCDSWEAWDGKRCMDYCDVKNECIEMSNKRNEEHWIRG